MLIYLFFYQFSCFHNKYHENWDNHNDFLFILFNHQPHRYVDIRTLKLHRPKMVAVRSPIDPSGNLRPKYNMGAMVRQLYQRCASSKPTIQKHIVFFFNEKIINNQINIIYLATIIFIFD
jgi:hypothetical protein